MSQQHIRIFTSNYFVLQYYGELRTDQAQGLQEYGTRDIGTGARNQGMIGLNQTDTVQDMPFGTP